MMDWLAVLGFIIAIGYLAWEMKDDI